MNTAYFLEPANDIFQGIDKGIDRIGCWFIKRIFGSRVKKRIFIIRMTSNIGYFSDLNEDNL
jgi:hypothetical protein